MAKEEKKENIEEGEVYEYSFEHRKHHGSHFGAFLLIFIGLVFLLNNLGYLSWNIWNELWKFWPAILILLGIQALLGRSKASSSLMTLITLFVFAGILAYVLVSSGLLILPPIR